MAASPNAIDGVGRLSRAVARAKVKKSSPRLPETCKARALLLPAGTVLELRIAEELEFLSRRIEVVRGTLLGGDQYSQRHARTTNELKQIRTELLELGRLVGTSERQAAADDCIVPNLRLRLLREVIFPIEGQENADGDDVVVELNGIGEDAEGIPIIRPVRARFGRSG